MRATWIFVCLTVAAAVLATTTAPAGAREQSPKCHPEGTSTTAASTRVRVFYDEGEDGDYAFWACDLLSGRRTLLAEGTFRDGDSIRDVRIAGRVIVYRFGSCPATATPELDPCTSQVRALDVHTRRLQGADTAGAVSDLTALASGSALWIEASRQGGHVVRQTTPFGGQPRTLDDGALVQPGSLALADDSTAYWTNGGLPRSAQLDPPRPSKQRDPDPRGKRACFPSGTVTTIAASTRIRVYTIHDREEPASERHYACDLRSGRRTKLGSAFVDDGVYSVRALTLAGRFVAYGEEACGRHSCSGGQIRLVDASRKAPARQIAAGLYDITDIELRGGGSLAWIAGPERRYRTEASALQVHRCDARGCTELDEGPGVAPSSLAVSGGSHLYWTRGGEPRASALE
jgi:hypothetical protein